MLCFNKENVQPIDVETEEDYIPSEKQSSQNVIRRISISRAVKINALRR